MVEEHIFKRQRRRVLQYLGALSASALGPHRLWPISPQAGAPAQVPRPKICFEETAQEAGLHFVTRNCATPHKNQPETMVAGVALFDYDNDGFLDIYCVNGA